ncbi:glucosamine-6-phosphate deaminase [Alicyclobacillus acidoterrestris]|uniref:Glucosamine-6-phosphate deaminase n=1 Tax=Alicyclobacillus acidoterrestris (strain ATCC 49025 / DSM 3922 / CIP 106132 / NCIMB 13137 / GD3B) TaxID=1356854 RepID=T0BDQ7_ALIAG|nr:glucosamine-6-phosphate deaminase [Alicyclobacillus acidoterrestris]EPZ42133.1 hypothetical protein N007_01875 [Alicyclobacillus acidoterrestris ATCC 49025]UNO48694.1 glucosamine-6-phosphate deaminase [Alicyclobacillus acidoterrestris]
MNIRVFRTPSDAGIYAASILERVVTSKERPVLGLATGGTVIPLYEAFVNLVRCGLDVSHVTTLNLDEYIGLAPDHPQSYRAFMNEHLFSKVGIPAESTHLPNGIASDLAAECERYNAVIRKNPIDIQILGIGVNGHIGFNEPSHTLITGTHVVNLSAETIKMNARFFQNEEEVPRQAITMGVQSILQAKQIILLAFGEHKAEIIREALKDGIRTDVPASILQLHKDVTVILDEQSASHLDL